MDFIERTHVFAKELEDEITSINSFANKLTHNDANLVLPAINADVKVIFDDIHKPYVKDTTEKLKIFIDSLRKKYEFRKEIDVDYNNQHDWERETLKRILDTIDDLIKEESKLFDGLSSLFDEKKFKDDNIKKDVKKLRNIFTNSHIGYSISGTYNHLTKTITIFTQNIGNNPEDYLSVFAHEYFHAIHHYLLDYFRNNEICGEYYQDVVLESWARYFEIEYLKAVMYNNKSIDLKKRTLRYSPIIYSYAGCRDLFSFRDFYDVLQRSYTDFVDALYNLVDPYEADIIMKINKTPHIFGLPGKNQDKQASIKNGKDIIYDRRINNKPAIFMVSQGKNYDVESKDGYIWAPFDKKRTDPHHKLLEEVEKGDIIIHHFKKAIYAVSIAKSNCTTGCATPGHDKAGQNGRFVELTYYRLKKKCLAGTGKYIKEKKAFGKYKYGPFNKNGEQVEGYLFVLSKQLATIFIDEAINNNKTSLDPGVQALVKELQRIKGLL